MKWFDSLTHVTRDGSWMGERAYDASLPRLLADMSQGEVSRACLVGIADYVDNEVIIESARATPEKFVPIAGLNPRPLPTLRRVETAVAMVAKQGFAGIKLHPRLNGYDPLDPKCLAAIDAAGHHGLVVLLDTLFRRRGLATKHAPDVIDMIVQACPETRIVLLHATGTTMLDMYEIVRANDTLILDFSFTLMRYRGSSRLDADMNFLFRTTDQLISIGSDFPEYSPGAVMKRFAELAEGVEPHRIENIAYNNLDRLFAQYRAPVSQ